ncbi:hypothetical protein F2P81_024830 [Scophthalmus maximus]|uniref:E3 ubiquitin-protein ligase TRIM39-like n=1 Tax=Scophthalmus maximus TaxID=52904 RepID=A0A6A4RRE8_SCOMX|nr:hypothetical protein F2P81_024830 [Scophthalmus maximus]
MAASGSLLSGDQFVCSICLDVFTDPVATPCGHNFCMKCISQHWAVNIPCKCPVCKEVFYTRPELRVNTLISQMADQVRQEGERKNLEVPRATAEDVPCDICTGTKGKALKSCLVCLASYCESHLEPHLTAQGLRNHQLVRPVKDLLGRMCVKHDKPMELFCRMDQTYVCLLCMICEHRSHDVVPMKNQYEERKAELDKTEAEVQQMIQRRRMMIGQLKHSLEVSEENANREKEEALRVFTALREHVDRRLAEFNETISDKQRPLETQAKALISELEQEVVDLVKRSDELGKLLCSEDHLHFLQSVSSLPEAPPTKNWKDISVCQPSYKGTLQIFVAELQTMLFEEVKKFFEAELKRAQQYAANVTLDPDTANPWLVVSEDKKQVKFGRVSKNLPDNPKRFSFYASVFGKQSFTSGRFYFEVQVEGKTKWDLGVARESVNRKGQIMLNPQNGYWTISLKKENQCTAFAESRIHLSLNHLPKKVGVFVDYEEGLVSFYDVDAVALIYSFTGCSFNETLHPFLNPCSSDGGKNSAPLIICQVQNPKLPRLPLFRTMRNKLSEM